MSTPADPRPRARLAARDGDLHRGRGGPARLLQRACGGDPRPELRGGGVDVGVRVGALFNLESLDGDPLPPEQMPAAIALLHQRPAHGRLRITGLDGVKRTLSVTGIPLFASRVDCVGMLALFWQEAEGEGGSGGARARLGVPRIAPDAGRGDRPLRREHVVRAGTHGRRRPGHPRRRYGHQAPGRRALGRRAASTSS